MTQLRFHGKSVGRPPNRATRGDPKTMVTKIETKLLEWKMCSTPYMVDRQSSSGHRECDLFCLKRCSPQQYGNDNDNEIIIHGRACYATFYIKMSRLAVPHDGSPDIRDMTWEGQDCRRRHLPQKHLTPVVVITTALQITPSIRWPSGENWCH